MKKRIRKVHLRTDKTNSGLACNSTVFTPLLTLDLSEVTCNCCKGTDIFKRKIQIAEDERVASSDELGIKKLKTTVAECSMIVENMNREQFNKLFDYLKSIKYYFIGDKENGEIRIPALGHLSKNLIINYIKDSLKEESKEPDLFTKYNLNATHKAFIKEYGEVEPFKQDNKNCFGCCFHFQSMNPESSDYVDCTGVKCIENKVKFRLKKEEIMSDKTEISINDGTPGKQLSCKFSKLSVGDYFLYAGSLCRKVLAIDSKSSTIEVISTGNLYDNSTSLFDSVLQNTVEMVEKVTIQYIRKEQ